MGGARHAGFPSYGPQHCDKKKQQAGNASQALRTNDLVKGGSQQRKASQNRCLVLHEGNAVPEMGVDCIVEKAQ